MDDAMEKLDLRKQHKQLYLPAVGRFESITVPPFAYLMVDGEGDPNRATAYRQAVEALYGAAYAVKFESKAELKRDYVVPPLEGLWWSDDMNDFVARRKEQWKWTMMIAIPDFIDPAFAQAAIAAAMDKKQQSALGRVRIEVLDEGRVVQTMHLGSYDDEGPLLRRLHEEFLPENGLRPVGKHHEIYLGDPRKTAPEKLKTVLRQPVAVR
ncbi:MAG TPA: GyrI-like domain-containing protein [Sphingomicrobium sp.]